MTSDLIVNSLLRRLGIPNDSVRNVILTYDLVPRAFACDYSPVAGVLRKLSQFSEHDGLLCDRRSIMYHFVGRVVVLQPASDVSWVRIFWSCHPVYYMPACVHVDGCLPSNRVYAALPCQAPFLIERDAQYV